MRLFAFRQRSLASEAFRDERRQLADGRLNQDPSLVVYTDFQDLSGALAEFELFSRALNDAERRDLCVKGKPDARIHSDSDDEGLAGDEAGQSSNKPNQQRPRPKRSRFRSPTSVSPARRSS